jgi:hypothetical protein
MSQFIDEVRRRLIAVLSLSERTIRSLAAIIGGASTFLTQNLLPESLRGTTIYSVTIGMMQQYIVQRVARMETEAAADRVQLDEAYVQRKMAGTVLETAGLLTIGFSPLWVFAIAGDVAGGTRIYYHRLVEQLKEDGILDQDAEPSGMVDLLEAIQETSSTSATAIDTPPLSREELAQMASEIRASYSRVLGHVAEPRQQLDAVWARMRALAQRESISIERLSGIMSMDAASSSKSRAAAALMAGQVGVELFDEKILDSYRQTLASVREQGIDSFLRDHMRPFMETASAHFDPGRTTWIEDRLGGDPEA